MTSAPMYKFRSRWTVFFRLAFDPNQISSVFAGFNCSLLDLHHSCIDSIQFLEFHDGIRNVRSRCILDKLSVVRIHVVVQEMVRRWGLPDLRCRRWIFEVPIPILEAHCSRLCEGAIVDLWPCRFVFDHWDRTRTTSEPHPPHKIDRAAPVP